MAKSKYTALRYIGLTREDAQIMWRVHPHAARSYLLQFADRADAKRMRMRTRARADGRKVRP